MTSLVRQWQTCDGNASIFVHDKVIHIHIANAGPGKLRIGFAPVPPDFMTKYQAQWKLDPVELPAILENLNLRQNAETINTDGVPLRISVIPKERRLETVHPPKTQPKLPAKETAPRRTADKKFVPPTRPAVDYLSLAASSLAKYLPVKADSKEMAILVRSVTSQWREYQGHACLFLNKGQQLLLKLTNNPSDPVDCQILKASLDECLAKLGFYSERASRVVSCLNKGHCVKYHDEMGVAQILWHDPKERLIKTCPEHLKK